MIFKCCGRGKFLSRNGLTRLWKTNVVKEKIKTEKSKVKEILEMLESQRKSRANEIEDE